MGTLGCINDMLQRDKENRTLRKLNRERMRGHYNYLVEKGKGPERRSDVSTKQLEDIRQHSAEKWCSCWAGSVTGCLVVVLRDDPIRNIPKKVILPLAAVLLYSTFPSDRYNS